MPNGPVVDSAPPEESFGRRRGNLVNTIPRTGRCQPTVATARVPPRVRGVAHREGQLVINNWTVPAGAYDTRTITVTVTDGQLTLRLADFGGADRYAAMNALTITRSSVPAAKFSADPATEGNVGRVAFAESTG